MPAKNAYERWLKPFNQKLFKKFDNAVISKIVRIYDSYSQLFLNFIQANPLKYAYYLFYVFSLTLFFSVNGMLISFVYTHGYIPNDSLGTKQFNQLGYVYKPYISKFTNTSWANNCNNNANNNQKIKIVKNQSQANFVNDPANDIFRECSKVNTYSTDQDQAEELFSHVLQDVLLKDKQFYIQGSNALLSYAPDHDQMLDHMNLQKIVNPNLGLMYHNNKKIYTGYLSQPSYQIAHREYYPSSNSVAMTGVIHGHNTNSTSFIGEQANFIPTYSTDTLHWDYTNYEDWSNLKQAMNDYRYDHSDKTVKSYHVANDPNSFGNVPTLNGHCLNSNFINPQIVINNNSVDNYQNIYTLNNTSNKYSVFNKEPINKSAIQAAMLNYDTLVRMYPAIATIAQKENLKQLLYQYNKTNNGYQLIVYGKLLDVSSQKLEHKYTATMFPFLPKKYVNFDYYDPDPHDSPDGDETLNLPPTPIKTIDDRIHYQDSNAQVAFIIKNGQICKMALKLSHTPQSLNRKAFKIDTNNAYETDVIDYNPQYNNVGLSQAQVENGQLNQRIRKTTRRYLSGHGSYLYQPQIKKFLHYFAGNAFYENRKQVLKYPHKQSNLFRQPITNLYTTNKPAIDVVYY